MKIKKAKHLLMRRMIRISIWILGTLTGLSISFSLILLIPSVQKFVVNKAADFITKKSNMRANVGSIHIGFPKTIKIGEIYMEDLNKDTLFFCNEIAVNAALFPLLKQKLTVEYVQIAGLKSNITKKAIDSTFNFSPLIKAFSSQKGDQKQNQKKTWQLDLNELNLENVRINYADFIDSTRIKLNLGRFHIAANSLDLVKNEFDLENIELSNTSLSMLMKDKSNSVSVNQKIQESQTPALGLKLEKLSLRNIDFNLQFTSGKLGLEATLKEAEIKPDLLDLGNQNILLAELVASDIDVGLNIIPSDMESPAQKEASGIPPQNFIPDYTFGDFEWDFLVDHVELSKTNYTMDIGKSQRNSAGMDYSHMAFADFNITADSLFFNKHSTGVTVRSLSVKEISGPEIKDLHGVFSLDNQHITAKDVLLKTNMSELNGFITLSYPGLRHIGTEVDQLGIESHLQGNINPREIQPFYTPPETWPNLKQLNNITVNAFESQGTLGKMDISSLDISLLSSTQLRSRVNVTGLPSTNISINYEIDTFATSKNDLLTVFDTISLPGNIQLPHSIALRSKGYTNLTEGNLSADILTDVGNLTAVVDVANSELKANLKVVNLDMRRILDDSIYNKVSFDSRIEAYLSKNSLKSFHSVIDVESFDFNTLTFHNTNIFISGENNEYSLSASLTDSALAAKLNAKYSQMESSSLFDVALELTTADLKTLNLLDDDFNLSGNIGLYLDAKSRDDMKGEIHIENLNLNKTNNLYHINSIQFLAEIDTVFTNFNLTSDFLDAKLTGNTKLSELKDAFIDHLDLYISLPDSIVSEKNFVFDFDLQLKDPEFFTDFLIENLEEINLEKFKVTYVDSADLLLADVFIPKIKYSNMLFEDLVVNIDSYADSAIAELEIATISLDTIIVSKINLKSILKLQEANTTLSIHDANGQLKLQIIAHAAYRDSLYEFSLDPDHIILDYEKWNVPPDNVMQIKEGNLLMKSASISRENQRLWVEPRNNHYSLNFENFNIQNITSILELDSASEIISGELNGYLELIDPFGKTTLNTELNITDLIYQKEFLGKLQAKLESKQNAPFTFDLQLQNKENMIHAAGTVETTLLDREVHMILESDISNASTYHVLAPKYMDIQQGGIKGRLSVHGNTSKPRINGNLNIKNLDLTLIPTNTILKCNGELEVVDNLLNIQTFVITDIMDNPLALKGKIDFREINNPSYDLSFQSQNFTIIDKKSAGELPVVGQLMLGMNIGIQGPQSRLKVNSGFLINEGTNIQYIMPGDELELITDEDIVKYVDFENPDEEILMESTKQFIGDSIVSRVEGIDFTAVVEINPKAIFSVIVNPSSGDLTQFQISGKLEYKYNDTRRGFLTGLIVLENGYYDLSFYGLVKKRFNYDPGSTVSWSGDVMDGNINFTARHTVRTNSVGLVSNEISTSERALYNQRLPYDVILIVTDKISYPKISFAIDLPERYRSTYPTLDSKLNIMNQPNMESERNKQVFALLVGGTFIPENPDINEGSSSSNFATTAARNSVNAIMTQQLNQLTGQFIKGFEIDMGVNTFEDYASGNAQTRTQLDVKVSKNLFNDRVSAEMESHINLDGTVQMSGNQSTAGMTEFAVSYKLTETGNYRIKAFRENAFDIFDGEIQNSGIAFIFVKEFDSFKKEQIPEISTPPSNDENDLEK